MRKYEAPGYDVPLVDAKTGRVTSQWYEFLTKRGVLDMPDVDNSTPITNGQVLVFNSAAKKLKPGSN